MANEMPHFADARKRGQVRNAATNKSPHSSITKAIAYKAWSDGMTVEEIAVATGSTVTSVKIAIARGLAKDFPA